MPIPTIQFFGLPGSGKTYLLNQLKAYLSDEVQIKVVSRNELIIQALRQRDNGPISSILKKIPPAIWHRVIHEDHCLQEFLNFICEYPQLFKYVFTVINQAGAICTGELRSMLGALARTSVEHTLISSLQDHEMSILLLADEWFYHRFYTLFANCRLFPTVEQINEFVDLVPATDGAIFIASHGALCQQRIRQRKDIPVYLACYSEQEQESILKRYYQLFEQLYSVLKSKSEKSIFLYDGYSDQLEPIIHYCRSIFIAPKINKSE